jgi:hypothetical protein
MVKIKVKTTLRNERYMDGVVVEGSVHEVNEDYAKQLVEEKGFAEYVDEQSTEYVEIEGRKYPKDFLEMTIPEDFVNDSVYTSLKESGIDTFGQLIKLEDPTDIKGIGDAYMEDIEKEIIETRNSFS